MVILPAKVNPASQDIREGLVLHPTHLLPTETTRQGRPEYRTTRPVWFNDPKHGRVEVPEDYVTDKHSLPGIVRAWQPKGPQWAGPAIVHDWLYETKLLARKDADEVYLAAMRAIGVLMHHRFIAFEAVRFGGFRGYGIVDPDNIDLVAPHREDDLVNQSPNALPKAALYLAVRGAKWAARAKGIPLP